MDVLVGLLIVALGSLGQSSSYVPINKIQSWSWESFWLVQGIFAWLVFPLLGTFLALPEGIGLMDLFQMEGSLKAIVYGMLWGVGGLTFGLSMRYLGVALGQSIALGTCAGFGTLFPAILGGQDLLHGEGLILLLGVCITLAGIAIIGYAGSLRARNMTEEEKTLCRKAIADYKTIRPVVQFGDIYRLVSPYDRLGVASLMYTSPEKDKAVFYWWKTEHFVNQHLPRVKMNGLSPDKKYRVCELNRIDNEPLAFEGKAFTGEYLMANGLEIPYNHIVDYHKQNDYSSRVLYLEEVK